MRLAGLICIALLLLPGMALAAPVVIAVAASYAGAAIATAAGLAVGTLAFSAVAFASSLAITAIGSSLFGQSPSPVQDTGAGGSGGGSFQAEARGRTQVVRSSVENRKRVYGQVMLSGPLAYAETTGPGNEYLHLVIPLAPHSVHEIGDVYLNDDRIAAADLDGNGNVTTGSYLANNEGSATEGIGLDGSAQGNALHTITRVISVTLLDGTDVTSDLVSFSGTTITMSPIEAGGQVLLSYDYAEMVPMVRIIKHLGADDQAADANLVAESAGIWTTNHRLRGVAYIYVRLTWSQDVFPNGIPNIKALVKGCDTIYDPRSATSGYTDNWALCVLDYLLSPASAGGLACDTDEWNSTYFSAAANVCDELVTLADSSTQARYTCNGTVDTGRTPMDILKDLMTGAAGVLTYPAGAFRVFPAAYDAPTVTLDENDLRGPLQVTARVPRRELFNSVRGTFSSPDNFWQPSDFPAVSNSTYAANDGGDVIVRDIALPYTTNPIAAQRIAKVHLEKSRQGLVVQMPCNMAAFDLALWDTVNVNNTALGWSSKVFRITGWKLAPGGLGVDLVLREDTAASYDWAHGDATTVDAAPDTNLPSVRTVQPPGAPSITETLYETSGSAGVKTRATVSWAASADAFVVGYEAQYRAQGSVSWLSLSTLSLTMAQIDDVAAGAYQFRVRAQNGIGVRSAWVENSVQIIGLGALPADPTNFSLTPLGVEADLNWDKTTDLDVRIGGRALLRYSPSTTSPAWNDGFLIGAPDGVAGDSTSTRVPHLSGTYMLRFEDSAGNQSSGYASVVTTEPDLLGYNAVTTYTAEPLWTGTLDGCAVVDGGLQLTSVNTIDDMTDPIDDWGLLDSWGGIVSEGTDEFSEVINLADIYTSRVSAEMTVISFDTGETIDQWLEPIDNWGNLDGPEISDTRAELYIAATSDDPTGSPTWSDWQPFVVGDYKARGLKFKARLVSGNAEHNIRIESLAISVDMPDREEQRTDLVSGAGTATVSWAISPPFRIAPHIGVTAKDMATGDYFQIASETASSFQITFRNSAGVAVSRTFNARGKAY